MNRFIAGDRTPSSPEGAKMLTRADTALDRPMILFQDIVEILHRSMPAIHLQSLLGFEPHDGRWITGVLVGVDDPRRRMVLSAQGLALEGPSVGLYVPLLEFNRITPCCLKRWAAARRKFVPNSKESFSRCCGSDNARYWKRNPWYASESGKNRGLRGDAKSGLA